MHSLTHSQLIVFEDPKLNTAGFEDQKNRREKNGMETVHRELIATGMQILTNIKGVLTVFTEALIITSTFRTTLLSPPFYG